VRLQRASLGNQLLQHGIQLLPLLPQLDGQLLERLSRGAQLLHGLCHLLQLGGQHIGILWGVLQLEEVLRLLVGCLLDYFLHGHEYLPDALTVVGGNVVHQREHDVAGGFKLLELVDTHA